MWSIAPERKHWVVQPLIDAGLDLEEIMVLLVRLSFDVIVRAETATAAEAMSLVEGRPVGVRAAWAETIDRMMALG